MRKIIFLHLVCILITFTFLGCKKTPERKENNPNDTFSFNAIVGYRSAEYEVGVVGGVCQVSITIFNARKIKN
jgi:hypothetical protein